LIAALCASAVLLAAPAHSAATAQPHGLKLLINGKQLPITPFAGPDHYYQAYVKRQVGLLRQGTERFTAALKAGNLAEAKALYGPVRRHCRPAVDDDERDWTGLGRELPQRAALVPDTRVGSRPLVANRSQVQDRPDGDRPEGSS
jgi:hypothetical protein